MIHRCGTMCVFRLLSCVPKRTLEIKQETNLVFTHELLLMPTYLCFGSPVRYSSCVF